MSVTNKTKRNLDKSLSPIQHLVKWWFPNNNQQMPLDTILLKTRGRMRFAYHLPGCEVTDCQLPHTWTNETLN